MEIPNDIDWALIAKYLAGDATSAEIERVEQWAAADPRHAAELDAIRNDAIRNDAVRERTADAGAEPLPQFDVEAAWAKSPVARERASAPRIRLLGHTRVRRSRVAVAASWLAAAGIIVAIPFIWNIVRARRAELSQQASADDTIYETHKGERSRIQLSDGTTIAMAADTRLRVSSRYGDLRRDVFLTGEALFDVTHDAARPFAVHVGDLVAQDLGTQFGVRAYAGKRLQIVVAKGAVSLGADKSRAPRPGAPALPDLPPVRLAPGDLGQLDSTGHITLQHDVDVTRYLGWTEGRLSYQLAPLSEIIADLDRWYDVDIRLADSSAGTTRVTMSATGKSIDNVMTVLGAALALHVERHGRVFTMH